MNKELVPPTMDMTLLDAARTVGRLRYPYYPIVDPSAGARATKAAPTMLLRTLSREWGVSHRNVSVVALHPGTVESPLSEPFISRGYRNRVLTPEESAAALLKVLADVRPGNTGAFYDWQGEPIPW